MSIKSRALAVGGSVVLAASLTVAAVHGAGAPAAHAAHGATAVHGTVAAAAKAKTASSTTYKPFTITSPNFTEDGWLPVSSEGGPAATTGCSGSNLAPTLKWSNVPTGTLSFAFVITDMDAPIADGFHHWIVYNIPATVTTLAGHGSNPYSEGTNDYGFVGYGGPCPPADGQVHHYIFTMYALNTASIPGTALTFTQFTSAIGNYVIGATSTIGKFRLPLDD
jgi:Raf kinase inhibitor-like YbhB/YbcL family protein